MWINSVRRCLLFARLGVSARCQNKLSFYLPPSDEGGGFCVSKTRRERNKVLKKPCYKSLPQSNIASVKLFVRFRFVEFYINVKGSYKLLLKGAVERSETEDCRKI